MPVPYSEELLLKEVERILEAAELRDRVESLHRLVADAYGFERIISRSSRMRPVFERARAAARSDTPVLILGETGTGKELIARAIHANSRAGAAAVRPGQLRARCRATWSRASCSAIGAAPSPARSTDHPGPVRGRPRRHAVPGRDRRAAAEAQAKLLRVLQDGEVRPVGGLESRTSTSGSSPPPTASLAADGRRRVCGRTSSSASRSW